MIETTYKSSFICIYSLILRFLKLNKKGNDYAKKVILLYNCRHPFYFHFGYARAFHLRMVQRKFCGRAFYAGQRVHLGTHETVIFPHVTLWRFHVHAPRRGISLPNIRLPLGHTDWYFCYPDAFLHLFWNSGHNLHPD